MGAPPKSDDPIATPDVLAQADGVVFGLPTRFGMVAAQVKAFMDSTGGLWATCVTGSRDVALACRRRALITAGLLRHRGALVGKPAAVFVSTGTQGGGQVGATRGLPVQHALTLPRRSNRRRPRR